MFFRTLLIIFSLLSFTSCITEADQQPQANKMIQTLNQALQSEQWDTASALFTKDFFKQMPKKYWQQQMKQQIQEKGKIQAFNLVSHQKDPRFGGDFYIYVFSVVHEHGTSHETITIVKPIDDKPMMVSGFLFK